jgi:hypothetical protein
MAATLLSSSLGIKERQSRRIRIVVRPVRPQQLHNTLTSAEDGDLYGIRRRPIYSAQAGPEFPEFRRRQMSVTGLVKLI